MKKTLWIFLILFVCGCALRHTAEIGRLQDYGANVDEQQRYVKIYNEKFEKLLAAVKTGQINDYKTENDFRKNFGEPIFVKNSDGRNDYNVFWLYRYCEKLGGSEKVYLYFDAGGSLVAWEHVLAETP